MHKILKPLLIIFSIIVILLLGLFLTGKYDYTPARIYEEYWSIDLPDDIDEKYNIATPPDFHGDGSRYTVFQLKGTSNSLLNNTSNLKNTAIENEVLSILNTVEAEKNWYPNFSQKYFWKKLSQYNDRLYIIYDPKTNLIYFIQDTM